jgi:hypothetical protein
MNDSSDQPNPTPVEDSNQPYNPQDARDMRREAREMRREERRVGRGDRPGGGLIAGAVLVVVGAVLLAQNFGITTLDNWWALFILIPAVGALGNAWRSYQAAGGRLTTGARGSLIGGLVLLMVTAIFLFNLNWGLLGPIVIILAGVGLLLNTFLPR